MRVINQDINCPDVKMVQWMLTEQDATASGPGNAPPMLVVLDPSTFNNNHVLGQRIRQLLAQNCAVAITPIKSPKLRWDPHNLGELFGTAPGDYSTRVEWQSKPYFSSPERHSHRKFQPFWAGYVTSVTASYAAWSSFTRRERFSSSWMPWKTPMTSSICSISL